MGYTFTRNGLIPVMDPTTAETKSQPPPFSSEQLVWLHTQFGRPVDPPGSAPVRPHSMSTAMTNTSGELLQ